MLVQIIQYKLVLPNKRICLHFCTVVTQLGSQVNFIRGKMVLYSTSDFVPVAWGNYRISH